MRSSSSFSSQFGSDRRPRVHRSAVDVLAIASGSLVRSKTAPRTSIGPRGAARLGLVTGAGLPVDFYPLAGFMSARRRRSTVTVVAFDVLQLNGRRLLDYDIAGRREALERLVRLSDSALTAVATFDRLRPRRRAA